MQISTQSQNLKALSSALRIFEIGDVLIGMPRMWYGPIAISDISCRISYLCIRVAAVAAAAGSLLPAASPQSICWSYRCSGIIINWVRRKRNRWEKEEEVHMFPRTSVQFAVISPGTAGRFLRLGDWVQWLSDMVTTEKIKVQRPLPSIPSVCQGGRRAASLFGNLRQSASQNLSEKNVAVLTAPSFLERFCEADWRNSETK